MVANFGFGALVISFLVSIYGITTAIIGGLRKHKSLIESARLAMLLTFPLLTISSICIIYLLVNGNYEVAYVSEVTSNSMPNYLKMTALWGGQAGSLLFWSWLMSAFASAVTLRKWDRDREFLPWVITVSLITLAFFLLLVIFLENPFDRIWQTTSGINTALFQPPNSFPVFPTDGQGLNPLLRHPGMIIHPPFLYLGFVSFVIPFAFAIAALITGRTDDRWIRITRRWSLWAWLFLTLGLILGMRWAYDVLPWLLGTPFLHSVIIQEKRGMLKQWNMLLIIGTYCTVIFGTFLTRSGVLSSVHAFAQSALGPLFFAFIGLTFIVSMSLLMKRWNSLRSEMEMKSLLSREALFLLNNFLFLAIFVICLWGLLYPIISEIFTSQKRTMGTQYYEMATGPIWALILLLMGIAPVSAWGYSTYKTLGKALWKPFIFSIILLGVVFILGIREPVALITFWLIIFVSAVTLYEFWRGAMARRHRSGENFFVALWHLAGRNRRRYGGYTIHMGVILMSIGIIGIEMFQTQTQKTIPLGGSIQLGDYSVVYQDLKIFDTEDNRNVARAVVGVYKGNKLLTELYPRRDYFYESQQPMTIPGVRSTLEDDLYVLLVDWQPITSEGATFKVFHNPLVNWLWLGGLVFIIGTLIAAWPEKDLEAITISERKIKSVQVEG
jgi:cytochrome c-type biogenesis protein CcmF